VSLRAILWALNDAPVQDPQDVLILVAMADHAHEDGTASWASKDTIAKKARCSESTVKRRVRALESAGVIRPGDQQLVAHLRADRRPRVWDLALDAQSQTVTEPVDNSASTGGHTGGQADPPYATGGQIRPPRGVIAVTPEPSTKPTTEKAGVITDLEVVGDRPSESPPDYSEELRPAASGGPGPWCSLHPGGTDRPCVACAVAREAWTAAEAAARDRRERERLDAARQERNRALARATPPTPKFRELKARLAEQRLAQRTIPVQRDPSEPDVPPLSPAELDAAASDYAQAVAEAREAEATAELEGSPS
jgi:hypothetical protein